MNYIEENYNFKDKTVVVTGSSRGLGREIALVFSKAGANLVLASRNLEKLNLVAAEIRNEGGKALPLQVDVTNKEEVEALMDKACEKFGRIDVLINNAGVIHRAPAAQMSEEQWDETIAVNLKGTFLCSQAAGKKMIENRSGKIVSISSEKGLVGFPERSAYCASKGGIVMLTKALAVEWAPYNIQVNAIAPTYIETEMTRDVLDDPEKYQEIIRTIPMKRVSKPRDLFGAIMLFASDASSFITGQTLPVDGGLTAW